jgi:hypothetical protein
MTARLRVCEELLDPVAAGAAAGGALGTTDA